MLAKWIPPAQARGRALVRLCVRGGRRAHRAAPRGAGRARALLPPHAAVRLARHRAHYCPQTHPLLSAAPLLHVCRAVGCQLALPACSIYPAGSLHAASTLLAGCMQHVPCWPCPELVYAVESLVPSSRQGAYWGGFKKEQEGFQGYCCCSA
jgi:hypothetical protein